MDRCDSLRVQEFKSLTRCAPNLDSLCEWLQVVSSTDMLGAFFVAFDPPPPQMVDPDDAPVAKKSFVESRGSLSEKSQILYRICHFYLAIVVHSPPRSDAASLAQDQATTVGPNSVVRPLLSSPFRNVSYSSILLNTISKHNTEGSASARLWMHLKRLSLDVVSECLQVSDVMLLDRTNAAQASKNPLPWSSESNLPAQTRPSAKLQALSSEREISVATLCQGASEVFYLLVAVLCQQLSTTDDQDFFDAQLILPLTDIVELVELLKRHLHRLYCVSPAPMSASSTYRPANSKSISEQVSHQANVLMLTRLQYQYLCTRLFNALFARNERRPFIGPQNWQWANVNVVALDLERKTQEYLNRQSDGDAEGFVTDMRVLLTNESYQHVLTCIPQVRIYMQCCYDINSLCTDLFICFYVRLFPLPSESGSFTLWC